MDVLVAFRDVVVVDAADSVMFDADVVGEFPASSLAVPVVVAAVPSSDVGAAVVVFVGSSLDFPASITGYPRCKCDQTRHQEDDQCQQWEESHIVEILKSKWEEYVTR